ncbi:hypothetical protein EAH72_16965 [Pseudomonas caspiana]|nr:hypothetical protein EAH72_16965 [Pseudomonas caspiana]
MTFDDLVNKLCIVWREYIRKPAYFIRIKFAQAPSAPPLKKLHKKTVIFIFYQAKNTAQKHNSDPAVMQVRG